MLELVLRERFMQVAVVVVLHLLQQEELEVRVVAEMVQRIILQGQLAQSIQVEELAVQEEVQQELMVKVEQMVEKV